MVFDIHVHGVVVIMFRILYAHDACSDYAIGLEPTCFWFMFLYIMCRPYMLILLTLCDKHDYIFSAIPYKLFLFYFSHYLPSIIFYYTSYILNGYSNDVTLSQLKSMYEQPHRYC